MHNWSGAILGLSDMNALLPDEYRITINTKSDIELTSMKIGYICKHCEKEIPQTLIKVELVSAPLTGSYISGKEMQTLWYCPECKKFNLLSQTRLIEEKLEKPWLYCKEPRL